MGIIKKVKGCWKRQEHRGILQETSNGPVAQTKHRIVMLGARKTGKTNLLRRFLGEEFVDHYEPTAEDFYRKFFNIGGEKYQVEILDAACERDFPAKRRLSILTADIFLLVFSLDDPDSLEEIRQLLDEIKTAKSKLLKSDLLQIPAVVCGNKVDLTNQRLVSRSEVEKILGEVSFYETSAKTGSGLECVFRSLASLGGLPAETIPAHHQILPIHSYQTVCVSLKKRGTPALAVPCAALDPLARRPSFTSDLRTVLGSSTKPPKPEKCQIQ